MTKSKRSFTAETEQDILTEKVSKTSGHKKIRIQQPHSEENLSIDMLMILSDDEIMNTYHEFNNKRNVAYSDRKNTYYFEVELAYIQRELQIRYDRRIAHKEYTDSLRKETSSHFENENSYPEFFYEPPPDYILYANN